MAGIELSGVVKDYGNERVVDGIDLAIGDGQLVVLLGPSGCGKTTTLRMIAGLEQVTAGEVRFDGRLMNDEPPERRSVGMVFQSYALYPHMTVAANLSFGLESRRARGSRRKARVEERERVARMARMLEIDHVLDHRPKELSGGQRQRVALGRALIREPEVFLLDEPLSNLDANLRDKMRLELARLHAELAITTVYVTHDQGEALTLADRLVVMHHGRVCQVGPPEEVYARPADSFVAGFLGSPGMNLWPLQELRAGDAAPAIELPGTALADQLEGRQLDDVAPVTIGVRPEHLQLLGGGDPSLARIPCRVELVENLGSHLLVHASLAGRGDARVVARLEPPAGLRRGERITFGVQPRHLHLFDAASGARLGDRSLSDRSVAGV